MKILHSTPQFATNMGGGGKQSAANVSNPLNENGASMLNASLSAKASQGMALVAFGETIKGKEVMDDREAKPIIDCCAKWASEIPAIKEKTETELAPAAQKKIDAATKLFRDIESGKRSSRVVIKDGDKFKLASYKDEQGRMVRVEIRDMSDDPHHYHYMYEPKEMLEIVKGEPIRKTHLHKEYKKDPTTVAYLHDYEADADKDAPNYINNRLSYGRQIGMYRDDKDYVCMVPVSVERTSSKRYIADKKEDGSFEFKSYQQTTDNGLYCGEYHNFEEVGIFSNGGFYYDNHTSSYRPCARCTAKPDGTPYDTMVSRWSHFDDYDFDEETGKFLKRR